MTRRWPKFLNFIEYANDQVTFQRNTEATRTRARQLAFHAFIYPEGLTVGIPTGKLHPQPSVLNDLWIFDSVKWPRDFVWEALATNQSEFKMLLDGMINGYVISEHFQCLEKHASHVWMKPGWANMGPLQLEAIRLSRPANSSLQYYERSSIQDPLDGIYWELREFLRLGGEQRLRKCPVCKRFFIQSTARLATYCVRKCRLNSNPKHREDNAKYQRKRRKKLTEQLIQEQLKKFQEAKARLRAEGYTELKFEWVCDEAGIGKKRLGYLRRWEEKEYGRPRITDLTRL
jgi:hypothetical protein